MQTGIGVSGVFLLLGVAVCLGITHVRLRRRDAGLLGTPWIVAACTAAAGVTGRLHYLLEGLATGRIARNGILAALDPRVPGSTFFGAMAGVFLALVLLGRRRPGGSLARLLDDLVPGLGAAITVGRIGCLLQGCCLGAVSDLPWAHPGPDALRHHPLPVYLALCAAGSAIAACRFGSAKAGSRFLVFVILFACGRAAVESFRAVAGAAQIESIALALAALGLMLLRAKGGSLDRAAAGFIPGVDGRQRSGGRSHAATTRANPRTI